MSDNENHSLPFTHASTSALDGRQKRHQQHYQAANNLQSDLQSPDTKPPRVNGDSQRPSDFMSRTNDTVPSSSYTQARQPINDAVSSAMHTSNISVSPEFIQLITQNVLQQLQNHQPSATGAQPVQPPTNSLLDQPDTTSSFSGSPTIDRAAVYTPPTPHFGEDFQSENKTVPNMPTISQVGVHGHETAHKRDVSPFGRDSFDSSSASDSESKATQPEPMRRASFDDDDSTVLEKIWGKLFDGQGQGTERLSQFLRGIAVHLIEDYEPKHSIVVTPDKMQKYYADTKLIEHAELYPWEHIFDDKTSSISRLLREPEIKAQHHLVQASLDARPDIPGLTPHGFATWMTLLLKAHPDHEFERLTKTVKEMPINNPDSRRERFPKELSRRQFPTAGDESISAKLSELMAIHCKVHLNSRNNSTVDADLRPGPSSPRSAPPRPTVEDAVDEHERVRPISRQEPASHRPSVSAGEGSAFKARETVLQTDSSRAPSVTSFEEDGSDVPTPQARPIERERKPYVAHPGQGKTYDVNASAEEKSDITLTSNNDIEMRHTKSTSSQQRPRISQPQIAIHQRHPQPGEGADPSYVRTSAGAPDNSSKHKARSNSFYGAESTPCRRTRSNSTYANESNQRYHARRSPSLGKGADFPRASAPDMGNNNTYQPPQSYTSSTGYTHNQPSQDSRYDFRSHPGYEPRDPRYRDNSRDRDFDKDGRMPRPRFQSTSNADGHMFNSPEEYFRMNGPTPTAGGQYPPTSYRERERDGR
ncbi:hypothetical protein H2198_005807 [Neophaeococcomyces mojaviensis]|uniref:Uncharacterized protein n=1 Tax=Neophaeococcomyces mojaviensis TaxID=3383035 RepID=A0ACC3A4T5_9EURO|nr:hypothetical protein H2198_005807 [Knufia sp. JES_112]